MEIKILTLNCWGIPLAAKDRKPRMQAIAEFLATSQYDIVCLQEVWTDGDYNLIKEKAKGTLPFSHYFYSGVIGSGICILSKYHIDEAFFHQWPVNGYVHKIQHGDWFGGKGVGLCCFKINNYTVNIYSAHLHAEYDRNCDEYQAHRVLQAYDTAQFIKLTSAVADLVILAGDLNTEPDDLAYRLILNISDFKDAYIEIETETKPKFGTNETNENSYTSNSLLKKGYIGKRIDYVMYHTNGLTKAVLKNYSLPLPNRVPHSNYSYSDHEGVSATFTLERVENNMHDQNSDERGIILKESIDICNTALRNLKTTKVIYWFITAFLLTLLISTIPFDAPFGYRYIIHIVRGLLTLILSFTFIMGSLWNKIEKHGILAGKLAMEASWKSISNNSK